MRTPPPPAQRCGSDVPRGSVTSMASWLPLDIFRLILDLLPPVARGRSIIAAAELHRALAADVGVWNRIWEDVGFYLQPRDRHQPTGEAFSSETSPIRLDLSKCARAISALKQPNALERLRFRKIVGVPGWLNPPASTSFQASPSFCNKQAGFGVTLGKSLSQGSYSDDSVLDDIFIDVSRVRVTKDLNDLPVVSTEGVKKIKANEYWRTKIHPVGDGSSFLLHKFRWSASQGSNWTLFHLDPSHPGRFKGDPPAPIFEADDSSGLPPGFQNLKADNEVGIFSRSSSNLVLQLFSYLTSGSFLATL